MNSELTCDGSSIGFIHQKGGGLRFQGQADGGGFARMKILAHMLNELRMPCTLHLQPTLLGCVLNCLDNCSRSALNNYFPPNLLRDNHWIIECGEQIQLLDRPQVDED